MGLYSPFNPSVGGFGQPSFGSGFQSMPGLPSQPGGSGFSWGGLANSPLAPAIVQLLGGIIGGIGQGREASAQRSEQRRQFDTNAALQQKQFDADEEQRRRHNASLDQTAPMRAAIMQAMAQRLGVNVPQAPAPQIPKPNPTPTPVSLRNPALPAQGAPSDQLQQLRDAKGLSGPLKPDQLDAIRQRLHSLF